MLFTDMCIKMTTQIVKDEFRQTEVSYQEYISVPTLFDGHIYI